MLKTFSSSLFLGSRSFHNVCPPISCPRISSYFTFSLLWLGSSTHNYIPQRLCLSNFVCSSGPRCPSLKHPVSLPPAHSPSPLSHFPPKHSSPSPLTNLSPPIPLSPIPYPPVPIPHLPSPPRSPPQKSPKQTEKKLASWFGMQEFGCSCYIEVP